ncbi:hypothetical protein DEU56DRAFT_455286 [Suillus clintonianus]|uniref:uncharacterized protein n=1 Tax=Suillus clintonianus TaxID=1904413 RepID=UPI001B86E2FC|nr:uncharacterized protein DEU56DRAFT_455286 [Suillus clintonianus]KAG2131325.1 hypothetical protein DEU56DRAFT_455286 [Suillus clintonianus]
MSLFWYQGCLEDIFTSRTRRKISRPFHKSHKHCACCFQEIKVDGTSPAVSAVDMICQQNDFPMFQSHQKERSTRKPDVVFLLLQSSLKAFPDDKGIVVDDHGVTNAMDKPKTPLLWEDVLACIEFKRKPKKLEPPPSSYKADQEYLPVDRPKPDNPTPAPTPVQRYLMLGIEYLG